MAERSADWIGSHAVPDPNVCRVKSGRYNSHAEIAVGNHADEFSAENIFHDGHNARTYMIH